MNSNSIRVYIAGPYISDPEGNTSRAMEVWHQLKDLGFHPFCPHLYHFMNRHRARSEQEWLEHDLVWMRQCDVLLRIPGASKGADREVSEFRGLIFYAVQDLLAWSNQLTEPHERVV